jgi:hypothetical protein
MAQMEGWDLAPLGGKAFLLDGKKVRVVGAELLQGRSQGGMLEAPWVRGGYARLRPGIPELLGTPGGRGRGFLGGDEAGGEEGNGSQGE